MNEPLVLEYAAFVDGGTGGNPAGVVLGADGLASDEMLRIAAELGHSETAFLSRAAGERTVGVRYFSPSAEVPFCGHATVAAAAALATRHGHGSVVFETSVGSVSLLTGEDAEGVRVQFASAEPRVRALEAAVGRQLLALLGLTESDLLPGFPLIEAWAGNWHPMVVVADRVRFDSFTFPPDAVRSLMDAQGWTGTVTVLHPCPDGWLARNLFPVGTITEDPATGSAAASTGAYLRHIGAVPVPGRFVIHQGRHVGRPSLLWVDVPVQGGITVSGVASPLPASGAEA